MTSHAPRGLAVRTLFVMPLLALALGPLQGCVGEILSVSPPDTDAGFADVRVPADVQAHPDAGAHADATPTDATHAQPDVPTARPDVQIVEPDVQMVVDTGPTIVDSGPMTCTAGAQLTDPIAGCMPTPAASTGDPHEDCVRRINQFRCECQHLPPLTRWRDGEACADQMAQYDAMHPGQPHAAFMAGICSAGYGQNECPGWPSVDATVSGCLQQMWDEGPGPFYGSPPHGHYLNMSSTSFSMVACGFYEGSSGVYALQNFQ